VNSTDEVVQATLLGPDDYLYRKEQQRKRAPKPTTPELPDAPCCAHCVNWTAPEAGDEFGFGERAVVWVITRGPDKGTIVAEDEVRRIQPVPDLEPLRTKPYFLACDGFFAKAVAA